MNAKPKQRHNHSSRSAFFSSLILIYIVLCVYRAINAFVIRTQFDPDEYWQTLEPAYCWAFGAPQDALSFGGYDNGIQSSIARREHSDKVSGFGDERRRECALTWEWTRRRSSPPEPSSSSTTTAAAASLTSLMHSAVHEWAKKAMHGPVRSYVSILPTYFYYLACRHCFSEWNISQNDDLYSWMISKGPAILHAIIVAAPTDLAVWVIARRLHRLSCSESLPHGEVTLWRESCWWQYWHVWALLCCVSNWFHGYALVRTYANSMEAMFLMVGIALLGPELFGEPKGHAGNQYEHQRRITTNCADCHRPQAKLAFFLGGISACVRFTSLAAWIPIGLIVTIRAVVNDSGDNTNDDYDSGSTDDNKTKNSKPHEYSQQKLYHFTQQTIVFCRTMFGLCAAYGLLGIITGCCVDRWAYGFWAVPFLGNFHFNVILGLGSLYGRHPFLWYCYAGIPAICGIILPLFLFEVMTLSKTAFFRLRAVVTTILTSMMNVMSKAIKSTEVKGCGDSKTENNAAISARLTLLAIIAPYISLHSFSEHKEFRFLLPILPLICILAGHAMTLLIASENHTISFGDERQMNCVERRSSPDDIDNSPRLVANEKHFLQSSRRAVLLLTALIILNYPHLLYLGIIHQRGPISVNRYLTNKMNKKTHCRNSDALNDEDCLLQNKTFSIHYLMGCHSTPLYSHLHIPKARVYAWFLDCSPYCRSKQDVICQSDAFLNDPLQFITSVYRANNDSTISNNHHPPPTESGRNGKLCNLIPQEESSRAIPNFLVTMQDDAAKIDHTLTSSFQMKHIASIPHSIKSLSWHRRTQSGNRNSLIDLRRMSGSCQTDKFNDNSNNCHDAVTLFGSIDIHFDHMEVYENINNIE